MEEHLGDTRTDFLSTFLFPVRRTTTRHFVYCRFCRLFPTESLRRCNRGATPRAPPHTFPFPKNLFQPSWSVIPQAEDGCSLFFPAGQPGPPTVTLRPFFFLVRTEFTVGNCFGSPIGCLYAVRPLDPHIAHGPRGSPSSLFEFFVEAGRAPIFAA